MAWTAGSVINAVEQSVAIDLTGVTTLSGLTLASSAIDNLSVTTTLSDIVYETTGDYTINFVGATSGDSYPLLDLIGTGFRANVSGDIVLTSDVAISVRTSGVITNNQVTIGGQVIRGGSMVTLVAIGAHPVIVNLSIPTGLSWSLYTGSNTTPASLPLSNGAVGAGSVEGIIGSETTNLSTRIAFVTLPTIRYKSVTVVPKPGIWLTPEADVTLLIALCPVVKDENAGVVLLPV